MDAVLLVLPPTMTKHPLMSVQGDSPHEADEFGFYLKHSLGAYHPQFLHTLHLVDMFRSTQRHKLGKEVLLLLPVLWIGCARMAYTRSA